MTSPGWFAAIGCAVLLILVNLSVWMIVSQVANGAGRNHVAGIRLPSLMRSDKAWHTGHVAARTAMAPYLIGAIAAAVLAVPLQLFPVVYVVTVGLSLAVTLLALSVGSVHASRAARRIHNQTEPSTDQ